MKIACVILTYNRLSLLQRCLKGVRNQNYKNFDIWVVDNASTDGTSEWIAKQKDLHSLSIQKNEGAANGFNCGLKCAYDRGYDWIWMMDDDGVPDESQLANLFEKSRECELYFTNALVCNIDEPEKLAFGNKKVVELQRKEIIVGNINPFNGSFIHRNVIEAIGYLMKEMYLYGCETEYMLRAQKSGFKVATVTNAVHYHPSPKISVNCFFPRINRFRIIDYPIEYLFFIRNKAYINHNYLGFKASSKMFIYYMLYYLSRLKFRKMYLFCRYYRDGYKGIVGKTKK